MKWVDVHSEGDIITIDGSAGEVYEGAVATIEPQLSGDFETIMQWADKARRMKVRANAETPLDTEKARHFGAEGIGLCRTEHMFFEADRIITMRQMIMAEDTQGRQKSLVISIAYATGRFSRIIHHYGRLASDDLFA